MIKEGQGVEGLVLRAGGDLAVNGEMFEEGADFGSAHLARVTLVMKEDVTSRPIHVGLLGPNAVVFKPAERSDLIEEFGWLMSGGCSLYFCLYFGIHFALVSAQEIDNQ